MTREMIIALGVAWFVGLLFGVLGRDWQYARAFRTWSPQYVCNCCGWHNKQWFEDDACPECGNNTLKART